MSELRGKEVGEFQLVDELGRGGMGVVYRAVHVSSRREAAIKILPIALGQDSHHAQRFRREAQTAAAVRHPNLVTVEEAGQLADGTLYLRMELVAGQTLKDRLAASSGRLAPRGTLTIGAELSAALTAVHRAGIVHRDLKPANVMLEALSGDATRVRLLDFGIARFLDQGEELTATGCAPGTPRYMAPEQCRGARQISPAADVYALGVLLFEALTGRHPLAPAESSREALLLMHRTRAPLSLRQLWPDAPAALATLLRDMLDKEPSRRPAVEQVAEVLTALAVLTPAGEAQLLPFALAPLGADGDEETTPPRDPSLAALVSPLEEERPAVGEGPEASWAAARVAPVRRGALRGGWLGRGLLLSGGVLALWVVVKQRLPRPTPGVPRAPSGMVYLPGGGFQQGSGAEEVERAYDDCVALEGRCARATFERELGPRKVMLSPYFLDATEVTNQAFVDWLNRGVRSFRFDEKAQDIYLGEVGIAKIGVPESGVLFLPGTGVSYAVRPGAVGRPVVLVTWAGAQTYCAELGRRLPTEAEWEYAASNGGLTRYPWGDTPPRCTDAVAFGRDQHTRCPPGVVPAVGTMSQDVSWRGVHDLAGSVAEWTLDRFSQSYGACGACSDPVAPEAAPSPALAEYRVVRGSSFTDSRVSARAAMRSRWSAKGAADNIGFRCALRP